MFSMEESIEFLPQSDPCPQVKLVARCWLVWETFLQEHTRTPGAGSSGESNETPTRTSQASAHRGRGHAALRRTRLRGCAYRGHCARGRDRERRGLSAFRKQTRAFSGCI